MDQMSVGINAAIRALSDVIAPAVDATHAQARDQLRLVIEYLQFVSQRLDNIEDLADFEFRHNLGMVKELRDIVSKTDLNNRGRLSAAIERADDVMQARRVPVNALRDVTEDLAAAAADTVRCSPEMQVETQREIERCVLRASAERIMFERSWYLPLGLDHAPGQVPELSSLVKAS